MRFFSPPPILFSIYTNDISCNNPVLTLINFADDLAFVRRLKDKFSLSQNYLQIELLNCCFSCSVLELNIAKTKELVLREGQGRQTARPASTDNEEVEIVNSFKCLGS